MTSLAQRRGTLLTALAMLKVDWPDGQEPEVVSSLRQWLGRWNSLGAVITGMERQGYDLGTRAGWPAWLESRVLPHGALHSCTASTGSAFDRSLARAVQKAARDALTRALADAEAPDAEGRLRELEAEQPL